VTHQIFSLIFLSRVADLAEHPRVLINSITRFLNCRIVISDGVKDTIKSPKDLIDRQENSQGHKNR